MNVIKVSANDQHTGTCNGRPVKFSQPLWAWFFTDTPGGKAVEQVPKPIQIIRDDRGRQ